MLQLQPAKILAWTFEDTPVQRRPIHKCLPMPLSLWWLWTEEGFNAWRLDVWAVIGWLLVLAILLAVSPLALIGWFCKLLIERLGQTP